MKLVCYFTERYIKIFFLKKQQYLATVVLKLQVLSSEVSNSLEEASLNALSSVPRSIREIENIRNESTILKKKIDTFHENLSNVKKKKEFFLTRY